MSQHFSRSGEQACRPGESENVRSMRKLIWFIHQSIDGFMAGRNGDMSVFAPAMTDELWTDLNRLLDTVDATVFGRKTYQEFEAYWPAASSRPSSLKSEVNFSRWIDETPKYVASKTLSKTQWQNSTLLSGSVDDRIRKLKEQAGKNLLVLGSRNLALQLLDAGLVDELVGQLLHGVRRSD